MSKSIRMYVRPVDAGQIVEVSYGFDGEGGAYRRTHDRSDGSTIWAHGQLDWLREPEGTDVNRAPAVIRWSPCADPTT
jgi:hypothetical protein